LFCLLEFNFCINGFSLLILQQVMELYRVI
jgi:hypothetical protein